MTKYKVQYYDTDCECWTDDDTYAPASRSDAESDMRALKRSGPSYLKWRIVEA